MSCCFMHSLYMDPRTLYRVFYKHWSFSLSCTTPNLLLNVTKVLVILIDNGNVTILEQVNIGESEVSSIVIRGATDTAMNDVERAVDDGVFM